MSQRLRSASDWSGGGALGSTPGGPRPRRRGLKSHSWKGAKPGQSSWKGAGPCPLGSQLRAGGALGCHKVNGRRRGVAVRGESLSLSLSSSVPERPSGAAARAQGGGPHPGRVSGPWPLPALQTTAAAAGSLPAAGLTVSA